MLQVLQNTVKTHFMAPTIAYIENNVYSAFVTWNVLLMPVRFSQLIVCYIFYILTDFLSTCSSVSDRRN